MIEDLNERAISKEQSGKAPGLDGFPVECLRMFFFKVNFITDNEILKAHTVARS